MTRVLPTATGARSRVWAGTTRVFRRERGFALLMVGPAFLVLVLTTTFPLVYLIRNSFYTINLSMPFLNGFAGLANYAELLGDARFWHALGLTAIYTTVTVVLQVVIGLGLALLVLAIPRGQWLFRVAAILPMVLAPVVVGLIWRSLMLTPKTGMVDLAAIALGLGSFNWLGNPTMAVVSVIAVHTWQWTPFAFLVFLASLASVPPDIYEAARIDRANALRRFVHITLPLIRPAIVIVDHPAHHHRALGVRRDPGADRRRPRHGDRDLQPLRLPRGLHRAELRLRLGARGDAAPDHARDLGDAVPGEEPHDERPRRACGDPDRRLLPGDVRLGVPGAVDAPDLAQERHRRAGLSAGRVVRAALGKLLGHPVRSGLDPAPSLGQLRGQRARDRAHGRARGARGLRLCPPAASAADARSASTRWRPRCCRRSGS